MTQLHKLDANEATQMVAESNPRQELADILSSASLFIFSAVGFCREYGVKPHFAHITEDQVCFSAAGYTMMRALDTSLTPEWAQSQLTALEKHLRKTAEKRLDDTRREIERLQGELKKMEGRVCMKEIRLLEAHEIDARVGQVLKDGDAVAVTLLLYKDARCDMAILDELFGPFGWKRTHTVVNGNLFCTVEVKDPDTGEWVAKQDVGTESNTEPEKGQASDSFKRACVNWGIGRELYTAPRIKIKLQDGEYSKGSGPVRCWQQFSVGSITYDSARNITSLTIVDRWGTVRWNMGEDAAGLNANKGQKAGKSATSTGKTAPTPAAPSSREKAAEKYKDDQGFWMAVEAQATGRVPEGFRSARDWFVQKRTPDDGELAYFDSMVELKKAALGLLNSVDTFYNSRI